MMLLEYYSETTRFQFDHFVLAPSRGELTRDGQFVKLAPQPLTVLIALLVRAGTLVSRDQLKQILWGQATDVDVDDTLNHCVARLRRLLGDSARAPRYIETVARMGYRFVAEVSRFEDHDDDLVGASSARAPDGKLLVELARVRAQVSTAPCFSDGVVAATLRTIHTMLGHRVHAIDRVESTTHTVFPDDIYHLHIWVQHRQSSLRVNGHVTEPVLRSIVHCAVFDVPVNEMLDAHDAIARDVVERLLVPLLPDGA